MGEIRAPLKGMDTETERFDSGTMAPKLVVVGIHDPKSPGDDSISLYHGNRRFDGGADKAYISYGEATIRLSVITYLSMLLYAWHTTQA